MPIRVLLVDDEPEWLDVLELLLSMKGWEIDSATSAKNALKLIDKKKYDLILCDLSMPEMSGIDLLKTLRLENHSVPLIMMTGVGTIQSAVEAMQYGAYNYITKPFESEELEAIALKAINYGRMSSQLKNTSQSDAIPASIVLSRSKAMDKVFATIDRTADSLAPILILGETGTGKSLIAHHIHRLSTRKQQPFLTIDCGAMPENLLESELFGYAKGAFTGAASSRQGLLQEAQGGTVFLDEVGELSLAMQAKLLRVLQEHKVRPLGTNQEVSIDVRFIIATNRNLVDAVKDGSFREDLYYRLAVITLHLPNLRERLEDIGLFVEHFTKKYSILYGKKITRISPTALTYLAEQPWKGNIRELENVIERTILLADNNIETLEYVNFDDHGARQTDEVEPSNSLQQSVKNFEKEIIQSTLTLAEGNRSKAAEMLNISRRTLYDKLKEYDLGTMD